MGNHASFRQARVLWSRFEETVDRPMSAAFQRLYRHYGSRTRAYHDHRHVVDVVRRVDSAYKGRDRAALLAAAWFHDVVYDARRHDNEERSAAMMACELGRHGIDRRIVDRAVELVLETKRHQPPRLDNAARALVDADLATLSASPERYANYSKAIRFEYAWVPEAAYRPGRASVLGTFLNRPTIYYSQRMRRREAVARANISREISQLTNE